MPGNNNSVNVSTLSSSGTPTADKGKKRALSATNDFHLNGVDGDHHSVSLSGSNEGEKTKRSTKKRKNRAKKEVETSSSPATSSSTTTASTPQISIPPQTQSNVATCSSTVITTGTCESTSAGNVLVNGTSGKPSSNTTATTATATKSPVTSSVVVNTNGASTVSTEVQNKMDTPPHNEIPEINSTSNTYIPTSFVTGHSRATSRRRGDKGANTNVSGSDKNITETKLSTVKKVTSPSAPVSSLTNGFTAANTIIVPRSPKMSSQSCEKTIVNIMTSMLDCCICFTIPEKEIYQCSNGHILCDDCHRTLLASDNSVCPTCRVQMSHTNPTRNLIGEAARNEMPAECENKGCNHTTTLGKITEHSSMMCPFRLVKCKYGKIGCDWDGVAKNLSDHEGQCAISVLPGSELLAVVEKKEKDELKAKEEKSHHIDRQSEIVNLLSSKCRNMTIKDVRLEKDDMVQDICCTPFHAIKQRWIIKLAFKGSPNPPKSDEPHVDYSVGVRLYRNGNITNRGKSKVAFAILPGPSLAVPLAPCVFTHTFSKHERSSAVFPLPFSSTEAKRFVACSQIHLRIVFIDQRRGLNRSFTSLRTQHGDVFENVDDEEEGDSDLSSECDHDSDSFVHHGRRHRHHHDDDYMSASDESDDMSYDSNGNCTSGGEWSHHFGDNDNTNRDRHSSDRYNAAGHLFRNRDSYRDHDNDDDGSDCGSSDYDDDMFPYF
eukprot:CFRG5657T1